MNPGMPHFMLFAETGPDVGKARSGKAGGRDSTERPEGCCWGAWRFVLRSADGVKYFEAADVESDVLGERLDLLTLVRALESLDQPSCVSLIGCSNYIRQGIQFGMPEWRTNDWLWEWFGQMVPVKNADLWQRLDRLMAFHQVECRVRRIDGAHPAAAMPNYLAPRAGRAGRMNGVLKALSMKAWTRLPEGLRGHIAACEQTVRSVASASATMIRILRNHLVMSVADLREPA
jgi:ribonuclease HI